MALFRCGTSGGGGSLSETLLWENPNKSVGYVGSTSTSVSLNGDMTDYTYLKFVYKAFDTDSNDTAVSIIESVNDFLTIKTNSKMKFGLSSHDGSYFLARTIRPTVDSGTTAVLILPCYFVNASGSNSHYSIPLYIYGLK